MKRLLTLALLALALLLAGCASSLPQESASLPNTGITTERPPAPPAEEGW